MKKQKNKKKTHHTYNKQNKNKTFKKIKNSKKYFPIKKWQIFINHFFQSFQNFS